jgi:hypothetical protein
MMSRLDEALEHIDLEGWIEQYEEVKEVSDDEIRIKNCPKCGNDKYKVYINVEKKCWICHRCSWGKFIGDICQLLAEVSGRNINDVRKELIKTVVPAATDEEFTSRLENAFEDPEEDLFVEIETTSLPGSPLSGDDGVVADRVRQYAYTRGLGDADIDRYQLRYSTRLRSYPGSFLVFPIHKNKLTVAWQGRTTGDSHPKYVSYDDIANWMWPLSPEYHAYVKMTKSAILVEGVFDAIGMHCIGQHQALCTFGKKISRRQIALLRGLGVTDVSIAWDAEAGRDIEQASMYLRSAFPRVNIVDLDVFGNSRIDPGDVVTRQELRPMLKKAVEDCIDVQSPEFYEWRLQRVLT